MRLADRDLNAFYPPSKRTKILKECNETLEMRDRLNGQIKIWSLKPHTMQQKLTLDELVFIREGKI